MPTINHEKPQLPANAVRLTREEASELQWKLIYEWPTKSDVWPYRSGIGILSAAGAISSLIITSHFRRKLKLGTFGKFSMYLPGIVVPSLALPLAHQKLVSEPILLQSECPVCIQFRSLMIQNIVGMGYPLVMAPTLGAVLANAFATYRLPYFSRSTIIDYYELWIKFTKPLRLQLLLMFVAQSSLAIYMANSEAYSFYTVLDKIEQKYSK